MIQIEVALGVAVTLGCIAAEGRVADDDARLAQKLDAALAAGSAGRPPDRLAIAATRAAYRTLGKDPARYRPAAEALCRRVQQGKGLTAINTVVGCNNLLSLETGFSIGTYDRARLAPPLACRSGRPGEGYEGIGRGPLNLDGLPILVDAEGAFGSPTSDSARTMATTATTAILMVFFGFAPVPVERSHLERAGALLETHCAARLLDCQLVTNEPGVTA